MDNILFYLCLLVHVLCSVADSNLMQLQCKAGCIDKVSGHFNVLFFIDEGPASRSSFKNQDLFEGNRAIEITFML